MRIRRGMYRLVHFPAGEHEDLVVGWLWSERAGIVSHDTALALYNLSDVLPARLHLTLPESWRARRLRVPAGMMLHYADVSEADRQWFGSVPVTKVRRTLNDCAMDALSPDLLIQAAHDALRRGLVTLREIAPVARALAPFGKLRGR